MKIIQSKVRFKSNGNHKPHTITLHHTAGSIKGSVPYLVQKGYGYHFLISKDGTINAYNPVSDVVSHSYKANVGYIGISYEAGGPLGPVLDIQRDASIELIKDLISNHKDIDTISDHASIDNIIARRGWKSDPQWPGEPVEGSIWAIKKANLDVIAKACKLKTLSFNK